MRSNLAHSDPHRDIPIADKDFYAISKLVYEHFGIVLGEEKRSLVVGRLQSSLSRRNLPNFGAYLELLENDRTGEILSELINQISTNFTSFFREPDHFDFFAHHALPAIVATLQRKKSDDIRVWCAACASGEEAYTIQISMMRKLGLEYSRYDAGLLATDISAKALRIATQATYSEEQLSTVPSEVKNSYFKTLGNGSYVVKSNVREQILFRRFNLMNERYPFKKQFQVIFLRNVMIYFDEETRRNLVKKFHDLLEPGGYLFVGHSETINADWGPFNLVFPAVYQKQG